MGFEVFVECLGDTARVGLPRAAVRSLFPVVEAESEADYWCVRYGKEDCCRIGVTASGSDKERLSRLYVERPCGDLRLWEGLLAILKMGSVVMFWPGGPLVVGSEDAAAEVPKAMTDSVGPVKLVSSAEEILQLLRES